MNGAWRQAGASLWNRNEMEAIALILILVFYYILRKPKRSVPPYRRRPPEQLNLMNATEFEEHCAGWLKKQHYRVELTGRGGDGNVDIIVRDPLGLKIGVAECKHHRKPVGAAPLKILHATILQNGVKQGWFFSLNGYTDGARKYRDSVKEKIELLTGRDVAE